jgi:hypothetical protein
MGKIMRNASNTPLARGRVRGSPRDPSYKPDFPAILVLGATGPIGVSKCSADGFHQPFGGVGFRRNEA